MRALFTIALVAALGCSQDGANRDAAAATTAQPAPQVAMPDFNADSAHSLLRRQVAFGPRVPGTKPHADQLAWMREYLKARADSITIQPIAHAAKGGKTVQMYNVIAHFNPTATKRVLFLAHWDTRKTADQEYTEENRNTPIPGANDGASGVAVLMILADMFKQQRPPIGVDLLFTDGEDWERDDMYIGAKHFAVHAQQTGYKPLYGVLIDMIADTDPKFPVEGFSAQYAPEVVDRVWRVAEQLGFAANFPRTQGGALNDDHVPLNDVGIHTIDIIDFEYGPSMQTGGAYWHTLQDTVENTAPLGLGIVGKVLAYLAYSGG